MTREKAIEILNSWDGVFIGYSSDEVNEAIKMATEALEKESKKTGRWIKDSPWIKPYCSECGKSCIGTHGFDYLITDFCPNCGAKMESEK